MSKKPKHVIFLGAGASFTSGFPLADDLKKKWLSSLENFRSQLSEQRSLKDFEKRQPLEWMKLSEKIDSWHQGRAGGYLHLFREGGFGTIDEFCFHLRNIEKNIEGQPIKELKSVLRFIFGAHTPERHFSNSDYYSFIQKLFLPNDLSKLNDEIVILSYNYDVYLEWLLRRAIKVRVMSIRGGAASESLREISSITSGFGGSHADLEEITQGDHFCLLKLHGMIAWPNNRTGPWTKSHPYCCFDDLFDHDATRTMETFLAFADSQAPIIFPWEIISADGEFVPEDQFPIKDGALGNDTSLAPYRDGGGRSISDPSIYQIYRAIWTRAREEVQAASKISFVGLSMHQYLNRGLRFLFAGRKQNIRWSITDGQSFGKENVEPTSSTARVQTLFRSINVPAGVPKIRKDFADFIVKELT